MASERQEVFFARVVELSLEDLIPALKTRGLTSYAKFAFGCDYNPQMADASLLATQLLKPICGDDEHHIPSLRRLWWEAWGVATADMRRQVESVDTDAPRKLTLVELNARRVSATQSLGGLRFEGELDVSDQLITECVGMADRDRLRYIAWEQCTKRELEVLGVKKDDTWQKDPGTGFLKPVASAGVGSERSADLSSDLKLDFALKRRGLALAMADLMDWDSHEKLRDDLIGSFTRAPPPGYARTSLQQVRRADEVAFGLLAKWATEGIKRRAGVRPLDDLVDRVLTSREYALMLQPLPATGSRGVHSTDPAAGDIGVKKTAKKVKKTFAERLAARAQGAGKDAADKGAGKGRGKGVPMPLLLRMTGNEAVDENGQNICFAFNLAVGCDAAPPGARCPRGRHICVRVSCRLAHGFTAKHGGEAPAL